MAYALVAQEAHEATGYEEEGEPEHDADYGGDGEVVADLLVGGGVGLAGALEEIVDFLLG
jgi:hypothetical protein